MLAIEIENNKITYLESHLWAASAPGDNSQEYLREPANSYTTAQSEPANLSFQFHPLSASLHCHVHNLQHSWHPEAHTLVSENLNCVKVLPQGVVIS